MATLLAFMPAIFGVVGAAAAMLLDAWGRRAESVACAIGGLVVAATATVVFGIAPAAVGAIGSGSAFTPAVTACFILGAVALGASFRTLTAEATGARVAALSALAATSAALLAASLDLVMLFLAVEALALCGYGLVALANTDGAREASMKWFVQGSVATTFLIVGIAVLLSRTGGALSYDAIKHAAGLPASAPAVSIGVVLVLVALAFKAGAFPFHSWMPDAFETAPAPAAAVLASVGKVAPLTAAVWLCSTVANSPASRAVIAVALVSAGSIVYGNLAALRQRSLARMLAYSAVAQVGYGLAGLALFGGVGAFSVLVFALLYGLTSVTSFLFIVALKQVEPEWDGSIAGLAGLSARRPALAASLAVVMLSLTGIPLTAGFWGKFLVFGAAATSGYLWLAIVGVLGSVVSFGYYGGVLRAAFMSEATPAAPAAAATSAHTIAIYATALLAVVIVVVGVLPFVLGF
jgi:proton-translocating NADH-quinone oxidoreductase chain N